LYIFRERKEGKGFLKRKRNGRGRGHALLATAKGKVLKHCHRTIPLWKRRKTLYFGGEERIAKRGPLRRARSTLFREEGKLILQPEKKGVGCRKTRAKT